jgi:signal transduction histidine kinase/CheY-like chemotaxis protein
MNALQRAYGYFGAHKVADRLSHERDRGLQRMVLPLLTIVFYWIAKETGFLKEPIAPSFFVFYCMYSVAAAIYLLALRSYTRGLVAAQYLFIVFDPLFPILAVVMSPELFGYIVVLLVAMPARCGIRYGLRTFWLEWWCAVIWFLLALAILPSARATPVVLLLGMTILLSVPLFVPLIRAARRAHELDVKQAGLVVLTESVAAKGVFLTKVSHEMRSPLQAILSAVDSFELTDKSPSGHEFASKIRRALSSLNRHLVDLLTLASSEAGSLAIHPETVDIGNLFKEVCDELQDLATSKHLVLTLEVPTKPVVAKLDSVRLLQILENLVTNAIRYTAKGTVVIRLRAWNVTSNMIEFEVEDTGQGIDPSEQALIFAPHTRAGDSTYVRGSSGMGLAVVRTLVTAMNGTIELESAPGNGSRFTVSVAAADRFSGGRYGNKVLVVDDREDVLSGLQDVIASLGFEVDAALGVEAAELLLASSDYAVVLCDLQMPVKTGVELAQGSRSPGARNSAAKWIAMTAGTETNSGCAWPFDAFVRKPIRGAALKLLLEAQIPTEAQT